MLVKFNENITNNKMGNKAKFLIKLKNNGFNVPNGFVLDSDTYIDFIKFNKIEDKIDKLLKCINKENIKATSEKIVNLFSDTKFNKEIEIKILSNIDNKKYAVRSSGVKEDLENFSFAGQYETFLYIEKKDIIQNIINCYKSMFSTVILSYIYNNNINFDNLYMSVVIQEMVDSEISGICFTINPTTGIDKEMLIEVSEGIGENIVSGKNKPEQYSYNWIENTYKIDISNKLLDSKSLEKIAPIFSDIQLFFGYPCDIEFAIKDNNLYILQAREITKIKYNGIKYMWSTADFKDGGVSAKICTPYMWSLYDYIWEHSLRKFIIDSKFLRKNEIPEKLGEMFYARCYWNLSLVKKVMSQVVGYKEREFDSEYGVKIIYEGDGATTGISIKSLIKIIQMALAQKKILKDRNDNAEKLKRQLLNNYYKYKNDYDDEKIVDIKNRWKTLTHDDYLMSETTYFWQIFINTIHQSLYKDGLLKYVSETDYLTLLSSIDNISHLLPFYNMWNVSRKIRKNDEDCKYWNNTSVDDIAKDIKKHKGIKNTEHKLKDVQEVITNYGYHSDSELDVTYPCYYEDINPIITNIKEMVKLDDSYSPEKDQKDGKEKIKKILEQIKEKYGEKKFNKINAKINNMRKMLWWREEFRDLSTRLYYIIRVYTIELAKKLKEEKTIENIDDIWFTKIENLWEFIDGKIDKKDLNVIIEKNKKYYNSYKNYMSENEIGKVFDSTDTKVVDANIKGLGANNGIVTAKARVITSFDEIDKLQSGEILVTKFTDTGWTPKFAIISGIITEYGGILCHAAIVSREYGIPAIVSCTDAMKKIKDGQIITIDGGKGIVKIEEE